MSERRDAIASTIRRRIVSGLHLGTLPPGSRLPSTRQIAEEFGVAPRTALAAYRVLEVEGLVVMRKRSGIYVAPGQATAVLPTQLAAWLVEVLLEARAREVPPVEFAERVRRCLQTLRLHAVCVAGNDDQMDQICHELRDDYGIDSDGVEPSLLDDPDAETQRLLVRADLIVSTAAHATTGHQAARRWDKRFIPVMLRPDLMSEMTRELANGPVYMIGSDPRFREAVRIVFEPTGLEHNMHVMIVGDDDLSHISPHARTYIMTRAHRRLDDAALARRVIPVRRVFSPEMARELLTFVVRANIRALAERSEMTRAVPRPESPKG